MKIERIELIPYALRFRKPYVTARGVLDRREIVLLKLHSDDGLVGLGEAVPLSLRGGASTRLVIDDIERMRGILEGASLESEHTPPLYARCERNVEHNPSMAAIDSALIDLCGKRDGVPAWSLLGATVTRPIECNATLVSNSPAQVAAEAEAWAADGFTSFKLKLGTAHDIETVAAVRSALGDVAKIRVDANGSWERHEAVHKLRELAEQQLELAEQPAATLEDLAHVREHVGVEITADESIVDPDEAGVAVRTEACDSTTIKLSKVGGTVDARNIAELLPAYLSSALDGPVGIATAAHLAQVLPDHGYAHGLATQRLYDEWPAASALQLDGPSLRVGDGPGLGVELDAEAIERLRIDVE